MTAPMVIEGAMNGPAFLAYIEQILGPTLKRGEIVVIDNLSVHKVAGVEEAIERRGARVEYLPKYSPDLNPIELSFSKFKGYLRSFPSRPFLLYTGASLLSFRHFLAQNAAIASDMPATCQFDRNPL
jgi:transposase